MKKKDVEKELNNAGWWLKSHAAKHDKWTNGVDIIMVPRHSEINENTARGILKEAKGE
jgi:predicted RNA binding protein YcfA (HicA-like mRNA interferase family)